LGCRSHILAILPAIVHARPPARAKAAKKLRPPPPCGLFVVAHPPKRAAALRTTSEVVRADPVPIRRSIGTSRKATAAEIAECLRFAGHTAPMVCKIAVERLLEHVRACGMVLMAVDEG